MRTRPCVRGDGGGHAGFKSDAPPMAIMVAVVGALSSFYPDSSDVSDPARRELACVRVIAKLPVIAALAFKTSIGQPVVYPRDDLDYAEARVRRCARRRARAAH